MRSISLATRGQKRVVSTQKTVVVKASRIELFSRAQRKGWTVFGNQVDQVVTSRKVA